MNRRQFIAGLMASTVAPAPPVPIMKPRSIGMSTFATRWGESMFPIIVPPWLYADLKAANYSLENIVPWQMIPEGKQQ